MITKFDNFLFENKMVLPKDILDIYEIFKKNNKELYVVGGSVRDFLIGIKPHDIDLVTNAKPNEIMEILKFKYKLDLQGKQFGVIRVFTKNSPEGIEIASYRKDIAKGRDNKGDNQKVDIDTADIYSDSERRDLRQNALYYDIGTGEIIDLVGGIDDINNNVISAVGEASERFLEDRLRILRTLRFASRNQSKISQSTIDAILKDNRLRNVSPIDDVSQERIVEEFEKAVEWASDHNKLNALHYYLELLDKYGMFDEMFPDLDINISDINTFNIVIIFALLFRDNDIEKLRSKLSKYKFPSDIADPPCFLLRLRDNLENIDKIPALYKEKVRYHVTAGTILEFAKLYDLNFKYINAFLTFEPVKTDVEELMKLGLKGAEIGAEMQKRNVEKFIKLL
jgi:tRNA nucleotidyltransferase/poly(A) polymerase